VGVERLRRYSTSPLNIQEQARYRAKRRIALSAVFVFLATNNLRIEGLDHVKRNLTELARKEANLIAAVEKMLPDFASACRAPTPGSHNPPRRHRR
jgi:hypothetical protein